MFLIEAKGRASISGDKVPLRKDHGKIQRTLQERHEALCEFHAGKSVLF